MARSKSGSADEPAEVDVQEAEVDEVGDLVDEAVDPTAVDQHDVEVHAYSSSSVPTDTPVEASETPSPSEQSESLTDERLLNQKKTKEPPEGAFQRFLYEISFHLIDIGDSRAARERKALDRRIAQPFDQGARYVPVLTRKGGVG